MWTDLVILLGLIAVAAVVAVLSRDYWTGNSSVQLFNGDRWGDDWSGEAGTSPTS